MRGIFNGLAIFVDYEFKLQTPNQFVSRKAPRKRIQTSKHGTKPSWIICLPVGVLVMKYQLDWRSFGFITPHKQPYWQLAGNQNFNNYEYSFNEC